MSAKYSAGFYVFMILAGIVLVFLKITFDLFASVGWGWLVVLISVVVLSFYWRKSQKTKKRRAAEAESIRQARIRAENEQEEARNRAAIRLQKLDAKSKMLLDKYGDQALVSRILDGEIWQGQTESQLLEALRKKPEHVKSVARKTFTREIWCYEEVGKNRYALKITLDDGVVSEFIDDR